VSDTTSARADSSSAADVAQAICALLPAAVLAWPFEGSLLANDLAPRTTGFGLAALLSLPGAVLFLVRRSPPVLHGLWLLLVPLLAAAAGLAFGDVTDGFEASRALIAWVVVVVALLAGARSDLPTLARGAALLAIAYALHAALDETHSGALGNSGAAAQAAALGAGAGSVLLLRDRVAWRVVGLVALGASLAHAFLAPVLTASVAMAVTLVVLALATRGLQRVSAGALATVVVVLALFAGDALRGMPARGADVAAHAEREARPAAGLGVRLGILRGSAAMFGAHPLTGVGPGQFAATFPPFRDAREIEASTHGRLLATESEVEHAHDDWIQPALEGGVVVGLAWIAFLIVVARRAWLALRGPDVGRAALGAGSIALLVHALAHAPITSNAASATLFAAAAGALLVRRDEASPARARRFVAIAAVLLLVALAPRAWSLAKHGLALQDLARVEGDPARAESTIARAAAAAPDSVVVRTLEARLAEVHGEPPTLLVDRWHSVLALRPHRIEALVQMAIASARAGDPTIARTSLEHALVLDPRNPAALQNLATLDLYAGHLASGLSRLDEIPAVRAPDAAWLRGMAARLALRGLDAESEALSQRALSENVPQSPEERYALARELRAQGSEEQADGWEARAHRAWATQHAESGRWSEAVRSLRQDLRLCSERPTATPVRVRLALAAALLGAGREDEAREQVQDLEIDPLDVAALPAWARERLGSAGLLR